MVLDTYLPTIPTQGRFKQGLRFCAPLGNNPSLGGATQDFCLPTHFHSKAHVVSQSMALAAVVAISSRAWQLGGTITLTDDACFYFVAKGKWMNPPMRQRLFYLSQNPTNTPPEPESREEDIETVSPINLETKAEPTNDSNSLDNNNTSINNNSQNYRFNFEDLTSNMESLRACESGIDTGRCEERLSKLDQIVQNLYSTHKLDGPTGNVPVNPPIISGLEGTHERKINPLLALA